MVGGDHACGAGGYTVGNDEGGSVAGENGLGSSNISETTTLCGGGYYSCGKAIYKLKPYFGQGGYWYTTGRWYRDYAGSGGASGEGGNVYYYDLTKIHAYNGDRITNEDYTTQYYEYEADGTLSSTIAKVVTKQDGSQIIPAKIFAQSGIIRETYRTNQHLTREEAQSYGVPYIDDNKMSALIKLTEQTTTPTTEYGQGIGSGAGYLEKSNGILKPISEYGK